MDARVERVPVGSFANRHVAGLVRVWLEERGLDTVVSADDGGGTSPEVGFVTGGATLLVAADQAELARELLDDLPDVPSTPRRRRRGERVVALAVVATTAAGGVATVLSLLS